MVSQSRLALVGAVVVVVLLVAGYVFNMILSMTGYCIAGYVLTVEPRSEPVPSSADPLEFRNLTAVEQRLFLEAYTSPNGNSRVYEEWSDSWFGEKGAYLLTYRGEYFEVIERNAVGCEYTPPQQGYRGAPS